jgi:3-oxoacid CoA-transferase subunit A
VEPGELDPEHVHVPGIFVQRVVLAPHGEKRIEKRTVAVAAPGTQAKVTDQAGA